MTRYVLDANLILRFLREDDPKQAQQARGLFEQAAEGRCVLVVPSVVLAEVIWVSQSFYRVDIPTIARVLMTLIQSPGIVVDEPEVHGDALRRMVRTKLDFVDCYLAARAAQTHQVVASFDRDLRRFKDVSHWSAS